MHPMPPVHAEQQLAPVGAPGLTTGADPALHALNVIPPPRWEQAIG